MHGKFTMSVNKYRKGREYLDYFDLTSQFQKGNHMTAGLMDLICYYSNRLSFREVEDLLIRFTCSKILSSRHISNIVNEKAIEISKSQKEKVESILSNAEYAFPDINTDFDIYDSSVKEVIVSEDGIQVNSQKEHHDGKPRSKKKSRINTDVFLISKPDNSYQYLMTGIDECGNDIVPFKDLIKSSLKHLYSSSERALNVVAITDGARNIRKHLSEIFKVPVVHILDWYHLRKKLGEYLSMLHFPKSEKDEHFSKISNMLWYGETSNAITYLQGLTTTNPDKLLDLINYLGKHIREIINYDKRKKANKPIGSGKMEKAVDEVIGHRQKKKGMSWRKVGSKSLGLLKIMELNNSWDMLWDENKAA
jgi:hypothetical protein